MLKIKNLKKHFGGIKAVDNCSFEIEEGKITALIGPNGAGKTTVFDLISGLIKEDKGDVFFGDFNITNWPSHLVFRNGLCRTFQQVRLFKNLTIKDHLLMAEDIFDTKFLKSFFGYKRSEERIKEVLNWVGLNKPLDTKADNLSYGQRKLLDLAMVLIKPGKFLMLDEPVAGINPSLRKNIKNIVVDAKDKGYTVLLIEHDMDFVMDLADKIIVMDEGRVLVEGSPSKIKRDKRVLEAYLGD